MVAPATQPQAGPVPAPQGAPTGQVNPQQGLIPPQAKQALLQFFEQLRQAARQNPQLRPVVDTFGQVAQSDPNMLRQMGMLLLDRGPQALLQVLVAMTQRRLAAQGGQAGGTQGPPRVEGGPPPGAAGPAGPPGSSPQNPAPVPQGPPQGAPGPMQTPGSPAGGDGAGSLTELLSELPPDLARFVRGLNPQQQQTVLQAYQQRGLGAVEALLRQVMTAMRGTPESPARPNSVRRQEEQGLPQRKKKKRAKSTPSFELDPLPIGLMEKRWGRKGPKYATIVKHRSDAKNLWKDRDSRIELDINLYNGSWGGAEGIPMGPRPGRPYNQAGGDIVHISSRPYAFTERVTAYCTWSGDRRPLGGGIDCPPWADDDDTINASQALEDWLIDGREQDENDWMERAATGDPRQPLPRMEAGGMALLGGAGFRIQFDPQRKRHPVWSEYVPINRIYTVPGVAIMYTEQMTLAEARVNFPEIDDYYPETNAADAPPPDMQVTVTSWCDVYPHGQGGLWHAICWEAGDGKTGNWYDTQEEKKKEKWIKEPTRIDFGFPIYGVTVWGGAPYFATQGIAEYEKYRGMGCLTMLRRAFKLFDLLQSAIATQALKFADPAVIQYYLPGTKLTEMRRVSTVAGATNYAYVGEKVDPLVFSISGSPDGNAILQSIWQEISNLDSPLLGGGSNASSGFQQGLQTNAASTVQVNPIMDALEQYYQLINRRKIELLIRKGEEGEIDKLPYPSRPVDDQFDSIYPSFKSLTPQMAKLQGTRNVVRYNRLDLVQQQMLWNMYGQAVQGKLINARDAMKAMGVQNPQRNLLRILQEAAVMNPKALEAMMGAAIMGGDNALFQIGWQQVLMAQSQGGGPQGAPGGPGGPPRGIPSPVGPQSGGPNGAPPAVATAQQVPGQTAR